MERAPHFHLWLVPKKEGRLKGVAYLAQRRKATSKAAEAISKRIRTRFDETEDGPWVLAKTAIRLNVMDSNNVLSGPTSFDQYTFVVWI
jgi:hypothetical protein